MLDDPENKVWLDVDTIVATSDRLTQEALTQEWQALGFIVNRIEPEKKLETAYSREDEKLLDTLKHWLLFVR